MIDTCTTPHPLLAAITAAATWLFVPGDRPERFAKAVGSGADVVVLDLEDAVAPVGKAAAREDVRRFLQEGGRAVVRINGAETAWHEADLDMTSETGCAIMLPKASAAAATAVAGGRRAPVVALIETADGVLDARAICEVDSVVRAALGTVDLAAELGVDPTDQQAFSLARQQLVLTGAAAGIAAPIDGVTTVIGDDDLLHSDTLHAARLGFTGKLCIHPRQIAAVRAGLRPSAAQIRWARSALDDCGGAVSVVDGHMIDKPVLDRARAILARTAERGGDTSDPG